MYKILMVSEDQKQLNMLASIIHRQGSPLQIVDTLYDSHGVLDFLAELRVDILILDISCPSAGRVGWHRRACPSVLCSIQQLGA